jgi:NADPH:quinone reductase-like Zn-dependent oxidoreductase
LRALIFDAIGEPHDVLRLAEVPSPKIDHEEVLVKVRARPMHPSDFNYIRGHAPHRVYGTFPLIAGNEGVGEVLQASAGARIPKGKRIAFLWPGSWAELTAVLSGHFFEVPDDIPDDIACQFSLNPVTAWGLLNQASAASGDWVLLTAATSTVSNLVGSIGRTRDIHIIGIVRGDAKDGSARSTAEHVLSVNDPDLIGKITEITGEQRVSALLDSVGGPVLPRLFETLATGGRVISYWYQDGRPTVVTNQMLIFSNLTWRGFDVGLWFSGLPTSAVSALQNELWSMIRSGRIRLPVSSTHELVHFRDALTAAAQPSLTGKVLLI